MYRYMGNTFGPKGFSEVLTHASPDAVSQIIIHKAHQPDIVMNFFDADCLAGKDLAEVNLFVAQTEAAATGDDNDFRERG